MPATSMDALARFGEEWEPKIGKHAQISFHYAQYDGEAGAPYVIADRFVQLFGYQTIGHNWEMLDPQGQSGEPRAALTNVAQSVAMDLTRPSVTWLGQDQALQCARDFCNAFDLATQMIVSNRFDGLWHPIGGSDVEWAFVGYDTDAIALLLIQP